MEHGKTKMNSVSVPTFSNENNLVPNDTVKPAPPCTWSIEKKRLAQAINTAKNACHIAIHFTQKLRVQL